jgi:hypothetical protein
MTRPKAIYVSLPERHTNRTTELVKCHCYMYLLLLWIYISFFTYIKNKNVYTKMAFIDHTLIWTRTLITLSPLFLIKFQIFQFYTVVTIKLYLCWSSWNWTDVLDENSTIYAWEKNYNHSEWEVRNIPYNLIFSYFTLFLATLLGT